MYFIEFHPQSSRVYTAQVEHILGTWNAPTHAASFHAIFDHVAAGTFNKASGRKEFTKNWYLKKWRNRPNLLKVFGLNSFRSRRHGWCSRWIIN